MAKRPPTTYQINGRIIRRQTRRGLPNLRVEAWDKDLICKELVGSDRTDSEGRFSIRIERSHFEKLFADRRPDLFFRVFDGDREIDSTQDSVLWNVDVGKTELEIEVDIRRPGNGNGDSELPTSLVLKGRLVAAGTSEALAGYRVRGFEVESGKKAADLGFDVTSRDGFFSLRYSRRVTPPTAKSPGQSTSTPPRRFALHIWNPGGEKIHETEIQAMQDDAEVVQIVVPMSADPRPQQPTISDVVKAAGVDVPEALARTLADRGVHTLADVRRTGGLSRLPDLPVAADHPAIVALDAHAQLSVLSADVPTNARLIERGYPSVARIADTTRTEFVNSVGALMGEVRAFQLHGAAVEQSRFLDNIIAARETFLANGLVDPLNIPTLDDLIPTRCHCNDCESAVSPLAYLADLLDYAIGHLRENGPVDLAMLTNRFHQPFGRLPATCSALDAQVRQVRIGIEVLRQYLVRQAPNARARAALAVAERDYRRAAYFRLLREIGTSYEQLTEARTFSPEERQRLADRIGVLPNRPDAFFLDPTAVPEAITEAALEGLFGLVSTDAARDPLAASPQSQLEAWRLERLADIWLNEDWPNDLPAGDRPLIDPDVIGPDDFRTPRAKANPADPDRAFDVWLRRRTWVDARLADVTGPHQPQRIVRGEQVPDMAAMFAAMYNPVDYVGVQPVQRAPWLNTQPPGFAALANDFATGDRASVERARQTLANDLALSVDGFRRLLEIQQKDRLWESHPSHVRVSDEEWQDVASLLVQATKVRFFQPWRDEEQLAQIEFGPPEFWFPEREPEEGAWPPTRPQPLVDPELVAPRDLPDTEAGERAVELWRARRAELDLIAIRLRTLREGQGLQAALGQALGDPANNNALPHDLDDLRNRLNAIDPAVAAVAHGQVETDLHMTVDSFQRLMDIRARDAAANAPGVPNPPAPPGENEWVEIYAILTTAEKLYRRYGDWSREEQNPPVPATPLPYWYALKVRLPRWRADAQARSDWQQALRIRYRSPVIDPDVIGPGDFVRPRRGVRAFDIWWQRDQELRNLQDALRRTRVGAANASAGFEAICRQVLGLSTQFLPDLDRLQQTGQDIRARLAQLTLTRREFIHLLRVRRLIDAGGAILEAEWSDVEAALTNVSKRRLTALWRQAERPNITLRPDPFRMSPDEPEAAGAPQPGSRRDPVARREWRETLAARIEQRQAVLDGIAQMLSRVEAALLPQLRDALILAVDVPGADVPTKGKRLTDLLLIDMQMDGCQLTTRISQAISTIQGLLWSVRTGQLRDTYPDLLLEDDDFDERWRWLGSYATWRAAMFVHLYPENVLVPTLRRAKTPGFQQFLNQIRLNRPRINPDNACEFVRSYADYYRDMITLRVEASCHAQTQMSGGTCRSRTTGGLRTLTYWFARAASGRPYWSCFDPADPTGTSQSPWAPIPGLDNAIAVLGAVPFRSRSDQDLILLFAKVSKDAADQLVLVRYNLSSPGWTGEVIELAAPEGVKSFTAVVNQQRVLGNSDFPPALVIQETKTACTQLYEKRIHPDGNNWEDDQWTVLTTTGWTIRAMVPVFSNASSPYYLVFQEYDGGPLWYRIFNDDQHPQWQRFAPVAAAPNTDLASGTFLGGLLWPTGDQVFLLWKSGNSTRIRRLVPPQTLGFQAIADFNAFNDWLRRAADLDLREVPLWSFLQIVSGVSNLFALLTLPLPLPPPAVGGEEMYRLQVGFEIGTLEAFIVGHTQAALSNPNEFRAWQRGNQLVIANSNVPNSNPPQSLTLADCLRRLFNNRFANQQPQPVELRVLDQIGPVPATSLANLWSLPVDSGDPPDPDRVILGHQQLRWNSSSSLIITDLVRATFTIDPQANELIAGDLARIAPLDNLNTLPALAAAWPGTTLSLRRQHVEAVYLKNLPEPVPNLAYLDEYYYFVPVQMALELQRNGHFIAALDWYRTVYDYSEQGSNRKVWYGLVQEETLGNALSRRDDWLLDPLNPHSIAQTRVNTYTRFTLLTLIRCFLAYADEEFTRDTAETLERARTLYITALELLDEPELQQRVNECDQLIGTIDVRLSDPSWRPVVDALLADLGGFGSLTELRDAVADVETAFGRDETDEVRLASARDAIDAALGRRPSSPTFGELTQTRPVARAAFHAAVMSDNRVAAAVVNVGQAASNDRLTAISLVSGVPADRLRDGDDKLPWLRERFASPVNGHRPAGDRHARFARPQGGRAGSGHRGDDSAEGWLAQVWDTRKIGLFYDPGFSYQFCVPPNPIASSLRLHAALNLYKMRHCRNIAGLKRQVEPYAAATDTTTGLPFIGAGGQLVLPGALTLRPTPYRYESLVSRAKELVQLAGQVEASMLAAIEKRDAELATQLRARQDVSLTVAGVQLQELRVREAQGGVTLAELQRDRAQFQMEHFQELLDTDLIFLEEAAIGFMVTAGALEFVAAGFHFADAWGGSVSAALGAASSSLAQVASTTASILSTYASYERRRQDWELQRDLAQFDVRIGTQNVQIAQDYVRVTEQERTIAKLQSDHAKDTAEFLRTKFTNAELYDWMSDILEGVYSFLLQQATATAKLSLAQLAFERQEAPPPFLQDDYWQAPAEGFAGEAAGGEAANRRGLTGSSRLLRDLHQLDQFAFETRRRKLELSRTISLARLGPAEFEQFRQTGVLNFATSMEMFDRDFPGHYLRQIKRVRVSIAALVPPAQGIRATLTSSGLSRIVIGGDVFQTVRIQRSPEQVALTSAQDASGLLEMEPPTDLLRPFEGIGVDAAWELRMPKASNPFDFNTIADVLLTVDYTALNSYDYREQVVRSLPSRLSGDRPFSFRRQFADAWYDLNNPGQSATPMVVRFETRREDFAANVDDLRIQQIVLLFVRRSGATFEVPVTHLHFTEQGGTAPAGGAATTIDGVISTRRGNAGTWIPMIGRLPLGKWELSLPNTQEMIDCFHEEDIEDILLVITFSGHTPAWPQ